MSLENIPVKFCSAEKFLPLPRENFKLMFYHIKSISKTMEFEGGISLPSQSIKITFLKKFLLNCLEMKISAPPKVFFFALFFRTIGF